MQNEERHKTASQELVELIRNRFYALIQWIAIDKNDKWYISIVKMAYKIPITILMILLSPIALVALAFAFIILA